MSAVTARHARTFLEVARQGGVTRAAATLNKSQTSITKIIQDCEQALGFKVFQRSTRGVQLTAYGSAFFPKAEAARLEFEAARELVPPVVLEASPGAARFFRMDVSDKWLDAFVTTVETRNVAAAAQHLGITSAAVSASLRKLEDSLGVPLFERTAAALEPTAFSRSVVRHIRLARNLLRQGVEAMASIAGVTRGRVVVGTLPFVRTSILPTSIIRILEQHPELDIATTESPYDDLITGLRCGDVDFVLGALRGAGADSDVAEEPLLNDDLSVIARAGHPLQKHKRPSWQDLLEYPWVLPRRGVPTRELLANLIAEQGLAEPQHIIETSSFVIQRGLVMDSDRLTVLSRHQCGREEQAGMLTCLDIQLPSTTRAIGITTKSNRELSPAAALLTAQVRQAAAEYA